MGYPLIQRARDLVCDLDGVERDAAAPVAGPQSSLAELRGQRLHGLDHIEADLSKEIVVVILHRPFEADRCGLALS